jgi:hypothetical protein
MIEWAGVGALAGLAVAITTVIAFWIGFSDRIGRAQAAGDAAAKEAAEAKRIALDAHTSLTGAHAQFALYREQVAREYIHREVMREVEERLTAEIKRLGERLDRVLELRNGGARS